MKKSQKNNEKNGKNQSKNDHSKNSYFKKHSPKFIEIQRKLKKKLEKLSTKNINSSRNKIELKKKH